MTKQKIIYREKHQIKGNEAPKIPEYLDREYRAIFDRLNSESLSILKILSIIYQYIDKFNREFTSTFSVCSAGCSYCCNIKVDMTYIEACYIEEKTGIEVNDKGKRTMVEKRCAFLSNSGTCSIYEYRPYKCRTFHTIDHPKYCESGEDHWVYGSAPHKFNNTIFNDFWLAINQMNEGYSTKYLHDYFPNL